MKTLLNTVLTLMIALCCISVDALGQGINPYVNSKTTFINLNLDEYDLGPLSDGIVTIRKNGKYAFYLLNGTRLYGPNWESTDYDFPKFSNGACLAIDMNSNGKVVLYSNRTIKDLPQEFSEIKGFEDGVAIVKTFAPSGKTATSYVNTNLEKIYPDLYEEFNSFSTELEIRPVSCGLRAYYSNINRAWGYVDTDGKIVIAPKFQYVRDFANGYAIVKNKKEDDTYYLSIIDTKGNEVCIIEMEVDRYDKLPQYNKLSDVSSEGIYMCIPSYGSLTKYYSVNPHKKLYEEYMGSEFYNGHAFLITTEEQYELPYVINGQFEKVGRWKEDYGDTYNGFPRFSSQGLMTLKEKVVLNAKGDEVIRMPYGYEYRIGTFSDEGYAKVSGYTKMSVVDTVFVKKYLNDKGSITRTVKRYKYKTFDVKYVGYCKTNGHVAIAFGIRPKHQSTTITKTIPIPGKKPQIPQEEEEESDEQEVEIPEFKEENDTTGLPDSIRVVPIHTIKIEHKYLDEPEQDVTYEFRYKHDTTFITVWPPVPPFDTEPGEEVELVHVEQFKVCVRTDKPNDYKAKGDDSIKFCWRKKKIDPLPAGIYKGRVGLRGAVDKNWSVPVWLEISDKKSIKTPYSDKGDYGYLTVCFNPDEQVQIASNPETTTKGLTGVGTANLFMCPMRVMGLMTDKTTGKTYLRVDGGELQYSNLNFKSDSGSDTSKKGKDLFMNLLIKMNSFNVGDLVPGEYRIEIISGKIGEPEFTFGILERFSLIHGWIEAHSEEFSKTDWGFIMGMEEKGLPEDLYNGAIMRLVTETPEVQWYPSKTFFGLPIDDAMYEKIKEAYMLKYQNFKTDVEQQKAAIGVCVRPN